MASSTDADHELMPEAVGVEYDTPESAVFEIAIPGFRPEYTAFEKYLIGAFAYVRAHDHFRQRVYALQRLYGHETDAQVFSHDNGELEGLWNKARRISSATEALLRVINEG